MNTKYQEAGLAQWLAGIIGIVSAINALESIADFDIPIKIAVDAGVEFDLGFLISTGIFTTIAATCFTTYGTMEGNRAVYYWRFWQDESDNKMYVWVCKSTVAVDGITNLLNIDKTSRIGRLYEIEETYVTHQKESSAFLLKGVISNWYNAFRTFALVALLSVLVYVGVRIILSSSSAEDKAKYKKMLVSWFTAICILFVLHYIMVIVLKITQSLIDIFSVNSLSNGGIDYFMTNIRNSIVQENGNYFRHWGYVIMYVALVILTVSFTYQYIKRLIFVSLLTMIAPLVALTYPLDKIRDGRAQAFSTWLKEYIFNCLIQPVHLLLYAMVVSSAIDLMKNPIIAIIALALFGPAEKFIRKLFGFEQASTLSSLGAVAGGAMLMNLLKNTPKGRRSNDATGSTNSNKIRETKNNSSSGGNESSSNSKGSGTLENNSVNNSSNSKSNSSSTRNSSSNYSESSSVEGDFENNNSNSHTSNNNSNSTSQNNTTRNNYNTGITSNRGNGVKRLAQHYAIRGVNKLASGGAKFTRAGVKAAGAFGGAIVGIAAGVADGEIGIPVKQVGVGALAGSQIGGMVTPKGGAGARLSNTINNSREIYQRGALGDAEYERQQVLKEFYSSDGWKSIENDSTISGDKKAKTQEFLDAGIYDEKIIHNFLKNNMSVRDYKICQDNDIPVGDYKVCQDNGISVADYKTFQGYNIKDINKVSRIKSKNLGKTAEQIAKNMIVAEHGKPFMNSQFDFVRFARSCGLNDKEADELWNNRGSYLI